MANRHKYTKEQDEFIKSNYTSVSECVKKFNEKFGTTLSYSALKTYANRRLKIKTGYRPWTEEMDSVIEKLLWDYSYKEATEIFNSRYGTEFTRKQVEGHCVKSGISRQHKKKLKKVDNIIKKNVEEKTYGEIMEIIKQETGKEYKRASAICWRANNLGLSRPHRVWNHKTDRRFIDGVEVPHTVYIRFIGHRFHRLEKELRPIALEIVRLQKEVAEKGGN